MNRKDPDGRNVFQGGFLGLDNIGVFDRSAPLPIPGTLTQSDGTSWMATYCLNMLRIALELAQEDQAYYDISVKFFEHFLLIGGTMANLCGEGLGLWDEQDQFFYDWLVPPTGQPIPLRLRTLSRWVAAASRVSLQLRPFTTAEAKNLFASAGPLDPTSLWARPKK